MIINNTKKKELSEQQYQIKLADIINGKIEYKLDNGLSVDIITKSHAYEVDFACKWYEAIGQALAYSTFTGKKPGIFLLCFTKHDFNKAKMLKYVNKIKKLNITIKIINCNEFKI